MKEAPTDGRSGASTRSKPPSAPSSSTAFDEHLGYDARQVEVEPIEAQKGVSAAKQEIGARVDELAERLDGDQFVAEVERLAAELSPDDRVALQEVLFERAAEEQELQQAVRKRFAERGLDTPDPFADRGALAG